MRLDKTISDKIEKFLEENGFIFTHNTDGWDNHYYSENYNLPYDIIFDIKYGEFTVYKRTTDNTSFKNQVLNLNDDEIIFDDIYNFIEKLKYESKNS